MEVFPEKEEMKRSLQNLENELKEARRGRDKAQQELKRLKQHLLEKVNSTWWVYFFWASRGGSGRVFWLTLSLYSTVNKSSCRVSLQCWLFLLNSRFIVDVRSFFILILFTSMISCCYRILMWMEYVLSSIILFNSSVLNGHFFPDKFCPHLI